MDILIPLIVIAAIFFLLGWKLREYWAIRTVDKFMKAAAEAQTNNIINVNVHKDHGQFYIYNNSDNSFITQVKTKEELFKYFSERHPDKTVMMKNEDLALFDQA